MSVITWALQADLDFDGTYETDLTGYIENPAQGLAIDRGMGPDGKPRVSQVTIGLSNRTGYFTPENSASPFFGLLNPGIPIRITGTHAAIGYTLWSGYAREWAVAWRSGSVAVCTVSARDLTDYLRDSAPVNVVASTTRDTDDALREIAHTLGLEDSDLDFDDGLQDLPLHFARDQDGLSAMLDVATSEMGANLWVKANGELRFENRQARLGTAVDDTWGDGTVVVPISIEYVLNNEEYATTVSARGTKFLAGQLDTPIFEFGQNALTEPSPSSLYLTAGQVWERTFDAQMAYIGLTALVAGTDYTANAAIDGSGADRTSSLNPTVSDLGGGRFGVHFAPTANLYVTKFQMRGQPAVLFADQPSVEFTKTISRMKVGSTLAFDVPFTGDDGQKMRDFAYQELRVSRYPFPTLKLTFSPGNDTARAAMLAVEMGDLIKYKDTAIGVKGAYVNDWWYVEALQQNVPPDWAGQSFTTVVTLCPSYVYRNVDAIAFDMFDRANGAGALGTAFSDDLWASDSGFDIVDGTARANSNAIQMPVLGDLGQTDQVAEVNISDMDVDDDAGVVFRYLNATNQYRAYYSRSRSLFVLEKNVAGVVTELAAAT